MVCAIVVALVLQAQTGSYEQAAGLVRAGEFAQAIPLLQKLVSAHPEQPRYGNLLGIALSGAGRRDEANRQFERVLKGNPRFVPALKNLAHNELSLGQLVAAEKHFLAALQLAPGDPSVHLGLGTVSFTRRDYPAAVSHYEQSNGLHLKEPLALVQYAASCVESGVQEKARSALRFLPRDVAAALQFEAGLLFARIEEYRAAAERFELARAGSFDAYKSGFNLALAYLKTGDAQAAAAVAEELLRNTVPAAEMYGVLAEAYETTGRTKEAYDALRTAIRLSPEDESIYVQLIALCLEHENQELGLEIANLGLGKIPASPRLRLQRGVIHALDSRSNDALADFRAVVQLNPDAPLGHIAEALTLLRMDRNAEAVAVLRKRAARKPADHLANWMLAEALVKLGPEAGAKAEEEAVAALERSVKAEGRMPQSRILLGKLLLARGDLERARLELEKAVELDKSNMTATYLLGQVYRKAGRTEDANLLFAKVSESKAEDPARANSKTLLRIVREHLSSSPQR